MSSSTISQLLPGVRTGTITGRVLQVVPPKQIPSKFGGTGGGRWVTNVDVLDHEQVSIGLAFWHNSKEEAEELRIVAGEVYRFGSMSVRTLSSNERKYSKHPTLGMSSNKHSDVQKVCNGIEDFPTEVKVPTISLDMLLAGAVGMVVAVVVSVGKASEITRKGGGDTHKRLVTLVSDSCSFKVEITVWGEAANTEPTVGQVVGLRIGSNDPLDFVFSASGAKEVVYCQADDIDSEEHDRLVAWFPTSTSQALPVARPRATVIAFHDLLQGEKAYEYNVLYRTCAPLYKLSDRPLDVVCVSCGSKLYGTNCYTCKGEMDGTTGYYFNFSLGSSDNHRAFKAKGNTGDLLYGMSARAYSQNIGIDGDKLGRLEKDMRGRAVTVTFQARTSDGTSYVFNAVDIQVAKREESKEPSGLVSNTVQDGVTQCLDLYKKAHNTAAKMMFGYRITKYLTDSLDELDHVWLLKHLVDVDITENMFGDILDQAIARVPASERMDYLVEVSNMYQSPMHTHLINARLELLVATHLPTGTPPPTPIVKASRSSNPDNLRRVRRRLLANEESDASNDTE